MSKNNKIAFVFAVLLFLILFSIFSSGVMFGLRQDYEDDFLKEYQEIKKLIDRQRKLFDEFFDKQFKKLFYSDYFDLFQEFEKKHLRDLKRIDDKIESSIFDFHYKDWSNKKFGQKIAYKISQTESPKDRTFVIEFNKDFDVSNVVVEVKDGFVTLESKIDKTTEVADKKKVEENYSFYFFRKFSLPKDIKIEKPIIEKKENKITIKFEKK